MTFETTTKTSGSVSSSEDLPIRYDLYVPVRNNEQEFPVIIFLHGFKGFKDWGTFPAVCEELSKLGFGVVAMNFSLNGIGENKMEFDRLDLFARQTMSQDLDDVGTVIEALQSGEIISYNTKLNTDEIGILGHSRGGHTAVSAAAEYSEIVCLATWSAVADYNARWSKEMIEDWESRGVTEIKNGRTGQIMPVKKVVYDDALMNADRVIALNRVKELRIPSLFVHSKDDDAVSYKEAEKLYQASPSEEKELKLVENTGHTFGGTHPFEAEEFPEPLTDVMEATGSWFQNYLQ